MEEMVDALEKIKESIQLSKSYSKNTDIYVVVNTKSGTQPLYTYPEYSISTDFFSDEEFSDILSSFRSAADYVEGIVGEQIFIDRVAKRNIIRPDRRSLIYCGVGASPGRSSSVLLPAFCEYHGIVTCLSDSCALALMDNKFHAFRLIRQFGGNVPRDWLYDPVTGWLLGDRPPNGMLVIAKPNNGAASIGVGPDSVQEFGPRMEEFISSMSRAFGDAFIVQEFINGYEVEVPVLDVGHPRAPMACGISLGGTKRLGAQILEYHTVYDDNYSFYNFDEENQVVADACRRHAENAYSVLGLSGIARIDYRIGQDGTPYAIDVSGVPHITPFSSASFMFQELGMTHVDLIHILLAVGHRRIDGSIHQPRFQWT